MSRRAAPRRPVALSSRAPARISLLVLVLLPTRVALAQINPPIFQDQVDLTGRQTLTLGAGARAYGTGGAFLARADDATAVSWNPAGLSYLRLSELSLVGNYNVFFAETGIDRERDELRGGALDFAAFTWPVRIGSTSGSVQVNYQRAVSFDGSRTIDYDDPFGERSATGDSDGGYDVIALGTGLRVTRTLRVGATLNRWFNGYSATQERLVPIGPRPRRLLGQQFHLQGWNSNLGLTFSPLEQVNLAGVFKTAFTANVELTKTRTDFYVDPTTEAPIGTTQNAASRDDVRIDFPWSLGFGVSWRPRSALTLSADYTKTNWSEATIRNYFVLPATPISTPDQPPSPIEFSSLPYPYVFLDSQNDTEEIRAGVEYVLIRRRLKIPLRAGYFNAKQIDTLQIGTPPRFNGLTVGTGIILGRVVFDMAYLHEMGEFVTQEVRNRVRNQRIFASLIYRFGRP